MKKCPLSGMPCPNSKVIHITEIAKDGSHKTLDLCIGCAASYLEEDIEINENGDLITDLATPLEEDDVVVENVGYVSINSPLELIDLMLHPDKAFDAMAKNINKIKEKSCSKCGMTVREFNKIGKMGCDFCYTEFAQEVYPLIQTFHKSIDNLGKVPKRKHSQEDQKKLLETELSQAITDEKYEEAADLKRKLDEFNCGNETSPP